MFSRFLPFPVVDSTAGGEGICRSTSDGRTRNSPARNGHAVLSTPTKPLSSAWLPRPIAANSRTAAASPPTNRAARLCQTQHSSINKLVKVMLWLLAGSEAARRHTMCRMGCCPCLKVPARLAVFSLPLTRSVREVAHPTAEARATLLRIRQLQGICMRACLLPVSSPEGGAGFPAVHRSDAGPGPHLLAQPLHLLQLQMYTQSLPAKPGTACCRPGDTRQEPSPHTTWSRSL